MYLCGCTYSSIEIKKKTHKMLTCKVVSSDLETVFLVLFIMV